MSHSQSIVKQEVPARRSIDDDIIPQDNSECKQYTYELSSFSNSYNPRPTVTARHLYKVATIAPDIQRERGYHSGDSVREVRMVFPEYAGTWSDKFLRKLHKGLWFRNYQLGRESTSATLRPDSPRINHLGKVVKYERPALANGGGNILDILPRYAPALSNAAVTLWITEGAIKSDTLASQYRSDIVPASVNGVWGWRSNHRPLKDFTAIALRGRSVVLAFDSDITTNPNVYAGAVSLARHLRRRGAVVSFCILPHAADGTKQGVDDYIAAGHTRADLDSLIITFDAFVNKADAPAVIDAPWQPAQGVKVVRMNERYLPSIPSDTRAILVKSPMGTGKTTALQASMRAGERVLIVSPRITLAEVQAGNFDATSYRVMRKSTDHECISTTLDSLWRIDLNQRFTSIIFDESEQTLEHLIGNTIKNKTQTYNALRYFIKQAEHVYYLDAHLGTVTERFAMRMHGVDNITVVLNDYVINGRKCIQYADDAELLALIDNRIKIGQRVYIACNQKSRVRTLEYKFKSAYPDKSIIGISAKNSQSVAVRDILTNINERITDYDIVIASPSVTSGVSIDVEHFDFVALFGDTEPTTHYELLQQLSRVRTTKTNTIHTWVQRPAKSERNRSTDRATIIRDCIRRWQDTGIEINIYRNHKTIKDEHKEFVALYADIIARRNKSMNALADNFYHDIQIEGYAVVMNEPQGIDLKAVRSDYNEARTELKAADIEDIYTAEPITEDEARTIAQKQGACSAEESAQLKRYNICQFYGVDQSAADVSLIEFDNAGRGRAMVRAFADVLHLTIAQAQDSRDDANEYDFLTGHGNYTIKARMIRDIFTAATGESVSHVLDSIYKNETCDTSINPRSPALLEYIANHAEDITRVLGITANPKQAVKLVRSILARMGIKVDTTRPNPKTRSYSINPDSVIAMYAYASAYISQHLDTPTEQAAPVMPTIKPDFHKLITNRKVGNFTPINDVRPSQERRI